MDQPNRINSMTFNVTGRRQTPKDEFGEVLATTLSSAVKTGAGIVGSLPGVPIVSAAVNAVTGLVAQGGRAVSSQAGATMGIVQSATGSAQGAGAVGGASPDKPVYENGQVREMAAMSDYYLKMQNEMQRESREYNAVSNIIKVRHDSAKAAINNIR